MDTTKPSDEYMFNRDNKASIRWHHSLVCSWLERSNVGPRLNFQHFWTTGLLGYHMHPSIPVKENLCIADIGTGTG